MNFTIQENDSTGNNPVTEDAVVSATFRSMTNGVSTMEISTVITESADVNTTPTSKNKDHVAAASAPAVTPAAPELSPRLRSAAAFPRSPSASALPPQRSPGSGMRPASPQRSSPR